MEKLQEQCNHVFDSLWFPYCERNAEIELILQKYRRYDTSGAARKIRLLNKLFDELCALLKLNRRFVQFRILAYEFGELDAVGTFEQNSCMGCHITIFYCDAFSLAQYVAIMLHELGHFFVQTHHLFFEEDEICTDILLIYLGFGDLLWKGYQPKTQCSGGSFLKKTRAIGYISPEQIEECQEFFCELMSRAALDF